LSIFLINILPEVNAKLAGYAGLISKYDLRVPLPDLLCAIGEKHKKYEKDQWRVFTPRHEPEDTLYGHLTFALKHEGIDLAVLKALYDQIDPTEIVDIVQGEPTGAYSRRIWFLYEWLLNKELNLPDAKKHGNFVLLVNDKFQYTGSLSRSPRHRVDNNLPGVRSFCPLVRRTQIIDAYIDQDLSQKALENIGETHSDLLSRAAVFLLLKDSKASYDIEGESPPQNRIARWGTIIGQAGDRPLDLDELQNLQSIVIVDYRLTMPGYRNEGGFVGVHDRATGMPIPDHISARPEDLYELLSGLIETYEMLKGARYNPVLMAAVLAFGFVFIHPFDDGNGRIHRYLFHHILAEMSFVPAGLVFPISAVILERIREYKEVLEAFSKPRLEFIDWSPTTDNNVQVTNETIDLYRYFDATKQVEFLFSCVEETVNETLPNEVKYLEKHDRLASFIMNYIDISDRLLDLLIRFLKQENGVLSKRAREKEFAMLTDVEAQTIEAKYAECFQDKDLTL
jgi:Fic family protein